ncbi:visinin-like [Camarhynchus parvulus]|uniref:visinin-like n=1 Tax=Geospiza parvula TaxID=87175 RepID=UPI00123804BC|nr:visinin-like [Camarhynchus parvulus]
MGNAKSGALSREVLEDLKTSTRYSEEELCRWWRGERTRFWESLTSPGRKTHLKLEWAFSCYEIWGLGCRNGEVSKSEVLEIITAIFKMIPAEEQKLLPEDENSPQKRADKLWAFFNKGENDKIAEAEFIEGVMKNDAIMRLIQYEPKK